MKIKSLIFILVLLTSCQFNKSVHKDLISGAYTKEDGLSCETIKIKVNGTEDNRSSYIYGEKVEFIFNNISGFEKKDGMVYPGLSILVMKNANDTMEYSPDLFSDRGGTDISPLQLRARFVCTFPYENSEKYKVYIKIWDKNGKGTFIYEMPFNVEENKLLRVKSEGIEYSEIYLWNKSSEYMVADKHINLKDTFLLVLKGLNGITEVEGRCYPAFSIDITESKGEKALSNPDLFEESEETGLSAGDFKKNPLRIIITFTPGEMYNPCRLKASLTDRKSTKRIDIEAELEIE